MTTALPALAQERRLGLRPSPAALLLLALHAALVVLSAWSSRVTTDEHNYYSGGRLIVQRGFVHDYTLYQGPVPLVANQAFTPHDPGGNLVGDRWLRLRTRLGTLPFAVLGAWLVYLWARALFGERGGLLALGLHALNPLMIGYGALILVDLQHAVVVLLTLFLLWRHLEAPSTRRLVPIGLALGLALGTKYLTVLLVPPVLAGVAWADWRAASGTSRARALGRGLVAALVTGVLALLVLHACYGFQGGFALQGPDDLRSTQVPALLATPVVGGLMRLLPALFVRGLDVQMALIQDHWVFLDGTFAPGHRDFYLRATLYKTPEVALLAVALALALGLKGLASGRRPSRALASTLWSTLPYVLVAGTYMSLSSRQAGLRYALPFFPLLFLAAGALAARLPSRASFLGVLGLVLGLQGLDLARNWPDWIAYYNTASGGQLRAWRHLRDSSSDFGQYEHDGPARMRARPDAPTVIDGLAGARFGLLAVDDDALRTQDPRDRTRPRLDWVTACPQVPPSLSASWWVFDVTPEALEQALARRDDERLRRDLALAYLGAGQRASALVHLERLGPALGTPLRELLALLDQAQAQPERSRLEALARAWRNLGRPDLVWELEERCPELRDSRATALIEVRALEEQQRFEAALARLEPLLDEPDDPAQLTRLRLLRRIGDAERYCAAFSALDQALGGASRRAPELYQEFREDMLRRCRYAELLR